jgi:anti-sigma factor RsiW
MKQDELDLLHGYLDGTIPDADFGKLQAVLRESAEARQTLRGLATVDAKLQDLGALSKRAKELLVMPHSAPARSRFKLLVWGSVFAAAACVALALTGSLFRPVKPSRPGPDVAATINSAQDAIARLSIEPPSLFPAWTSPTASLLEPPDFSESNLPAIGN